VSPAEAARTTAATVTGPSYNHPDERLLVSVSPVSLRP
jgi:hypothetical protein